MTMQELVSAIASKHFANGICVNRPASPTEIAAVEQKIGFELPKDFREFYSICNGFFCNEDLFQMKSLQLITEYDNDFGPDWFYFSDYMINSDMWALRKNAHGGFEIFPSTEIILTDSLHEFLSHFLAGDVFGTGGLYDWLERIT